MGSTVDSGPGWANSGRVPFVCGCVGGWRAGERARWVGLGWVLPCSECQLTGTTSLAALHPSIPRSIPRSTIITTPRPFFSLSFLPPPPPVALIVQRNPHHNHCTLHTAHCTSLFSSCFPPSLQDSTLEDHLGLLTRPFASSSWLRSRTCTGSTHIQTPTYPRLRHTS